MTVRCNPVVVTGRVVTVLALALLISACGGKSDVSEPPVIPEMPEPGGVIDPETGPSDPSELTDNLSDFDGESLWLSIDDRRIGTANASYTATPPAVVHIPEYVAREWLVSAGSALNVLAHTTWNSENYADYVTFGAWAKETSNVGLPIASVDVAPLFDGPEFRHSTAISSGAGRATYRGAAMGAYKNAASPGSDYGFFAGGLELDADFESQVVTGCIGCDAIGISTYPGGRPAVSSLAGLTNVRIRLEEGTISDSNSTYRGARITAESKTSSLSVSNSSGSWGGVFSYRQTVGDNPRAAGGTTDGRITWGNGVTVLFSTGFVGGSE